MLAPSELPINSDGSVFHLHLRPEDISDKIILVGDQNRVSMIASRFDSIECDIQSREFHTITGSYKEKRLTVLSTGIGCDNIDIVMNELDALVNIDLKSQEIKPEHTTLTLVRLGTCGGLQPYTPIGTYIASVKSIGFDGLLNYYEGRNSVCDTIMEEDFMNHMEWSEKKGHPYIAQADTALIEQITGSPMDTISEGGFVKGYTVACGGFYGPQGRQIRLHIQDPKQNEKIESYQYPLDSKKDVMLHICNFEMESSALAGLASLLGHRAMTTCMVIANRYNKEMNTEYESSIENLIEIVLDRI